MDKVDVRLCRVRLLASPPLFDLFSFVSLVILVLMSWLMALVSVINRSSLSPPIVVVFSNQAQVSAMQEMEIGEGSHTSTGLDRRPNLIVVASFDGFDVVTDLGQLLADFGYIVVKDLHPWIV